MTKKFTVEMPKELHAKIKMLAALNDKSMNDYIAEQLAKAVTEGEKKN